MKLHVFSTFDFIPFDNFLVQGFATGDLEEDAFAPRFFVEEGHDIIVCQSYSKNLGLYAERVGALNVVTSSKEVWLLNKLGVKCCFGAMDMCYELTKCVHTHYQA